MDYSVILPAYNEASNIGLSIDSVKIAAQKAGIVFEIIVVDNCSTDDTAVLARNHGAVVLQDTCGQRHTIAHLRNMGAAIAKGRILAFLDSDMSVPENWFLAAERIFQPDFIGLIGFVETVPDNAGRVAKAWGDMRFVGAAREVDFIDGRNMLIPKQFFLETGGFDDSLVTCEDKEFGMRVKKGGWPVLRSPEAVLIHWGYERNLWEFIKKEFWRQGSSLYMMNRLGVNLRTLRHPILSIYHLLMPFLSILLFVFAAPLVSIFVFIIMWLLPSIVIVFSKAMTGRKHLFFFGLLTFIRWNISGAALLKQFMIGGYLDKNKNIFFLLIKKVFRRVVRPFFASRTHDVVRLDLQHFKCDRLSFSECSNDLVELKPEAIQHIAPFLEKDRVATIKQRMETSKCLVLYSHSNMVGWLWITELPRLKEGDQEFCYPIYPLAGHVYLYDFYILPHKRGQGFAYRLMACACMWLVQNGYHFLFFTHDHASMAMKSITGRLRLGFELMGQLRYRRILWHYSSDITALATVCQLFQDDQAI